MWKGLLKKKDCQYAFFNVHLKAFVNQVLMIIFISRLTMTAEEYC